MMTVVWLVCCLPGEVDICHVLWQDVLQQHLVHKLGPLGVLLVSLQLPLPLEVQKVDILILAVWGQFRCQVFFLVLQCDGTENLNLALAQYEEVEKDGGEEGEV